MNLDQILQLGAVGLISGSVYALLGVSFGLILGTTGRFHIAYVVTFVAAPYSAYWLIDSYGANFWLAAGLGVVVAIALGVLAERLVYAPIHRSVGDESLISIFVASLGLTIAVQGLIQYEFGSSALRLRGLPREPLAVGPVNFTSLDVLIVGTFIVAVAALSLFLARTPYGGRIRGVRGNPELTRVVGIDPVRVYVVVFAIGSAVAGILGILWGSKIALVPTMGMGPVFTAFVVAFIGGLTRSPVRVATAGLLIGLVESLSGIWLNAQWAPLVVFSILLVFLIFKSFGIRLPSLRSPGSGERAGDAAPAPSPVRDSELQPEKSSARPTTGA